MNPDQIAAVNDGRPVVFRNATVLTMDEAGLIDGGDVLVVGETIAEVGRDIAAPDGAVEIDAAGGIVMPGMVDTHRHMWQTALRGLGADWTLSQYFVFYYLTWGKIFRPEDVHAGNVLSAIEAVDSGVTTTLDWSHGLQTIEHGEAAADALRASPGRFVLAYGNLLGAPWEWANSPEFRRFAGGFDSSGGKLGLQLAFDVTADPEFPEKAAFEAARELGLRVTTHAGVWGATNDQSIALMWENGFMTPDVTYVHAATLSQDSYQRIAATGGAVSVSTESEQSAGQGYPPTWEIRRHGIPVSLSMDTSVWWSADLFSAMRATLSADRSREHLEAHARGETVVHNQLRAEEVVRWATIGGAKVLGLDSAIGSLTPGKKADIVLIKNDDSPAMYPLLHPYGSVVYQAGRGDVHTVLVNGRVVKHDHRLVGVDLTAAKEAVGRTVEYARSTMGEDAWQESLTPELPTAERVPNPYTYTDYDGGEDRHRAQQD
ncbi:amidohydrolase family protein [Actinoallomurus bryophytorum]|uniref:Cytosine/adenosine deaminase-related metal-dependent hydrolase n=1 Tax=Actinoallomurus bryophytorum TaxID=1490222 RepID=A0A543CPP6_9ACTN|nr:amidohydrolase family protein [Actinoallomurus bryophytorum]TQL99081.1 cytosine/adenosine deaminase-related metal-dependent hydrolase [Actinoallomurus bryophytorum]